MTIYQCDMCHKNFQAKKDLLRLTVYAERYNEDPHILCYRPTGLRVQSELCENCTTTVANTVCDMIANGGVTVE